MWGLGPRKVGGGGGVLGAFGVTVGSAHSMNSSCPPSVQPKTLWTQSPLAYSLLGLRACVTQILASAQPRLCVRPHLCVRPASVCIIIAKIGLFPGCKGCASRGSAALVGCCFLKATSSVRPVPLSPQPPPELRKAHLPCLCSPWDGPSVSSHALFVQVISFPFSL